MIIPQNWGINDDSIDWYINGSLSGIANKNKFKCKYLHQCKLQWKASIKNGSLCTLNEWSYHYEKSSKKNYLEWQLRLLISLSYFNSWKFSKSEKTRKCSCHFSSFKDKGQTGNWKGNSTGKNVDCSLFPLKMHWFLLYNLLCKLCVMHLTFLICQKCFLKEWYKTPKNNKILSKLLWPRIFWIVTKTEKGASSSYPRFPLVL